MAISKIWNIESVDVLNNLFDFQNVVRKIRWKLTVQNDGENNTPPQIVSISGEVNLDLPYDSTSYMNFESLTETELLNWVFTALGPKKYNYEVEVEGHLVNVLMNADSNISIVENKPLPWI